MTLIGIAADHGGFELKVQLIASLKAAGYEVVDFGAYQLDIGDDYPDFVVPLARAVAKGEVVRGLAICGSGVGGLHCGEQNTRRACGADHGFFLRSPGGRRRRHERYVFGGPSHRRCSIPGFGLDIPECPFH